MHLLLGVLVAWSAGAVGKGAAEEDFLNIHPEMPVVEYDASIVLNCSSSCSGIGFEVSLGGVEAGTGPTWKAFNFTKVDQWTSTPLCYAKCRDGSTKYRRANFTVYRTPDRVELDGLQKIEAGKELTLTCQVFNVAPIRNLTVTLFKGEKALLVQTFEGRVKPQPDNVSVTHAITVEKQDRDEKVTCHAALDLTPEGPLLEYTSPSESLEPVAFSMDPLLGSPLSAETDTEMTVTCDISGVFPAEEAEFELSFAGMNLDPNITVSGERAIAQASVFPASAGNQELICTVSLGPVTRTVNKTVNVYTLPKPVLIVDDAEVVVNTTVNVTCKLDGPKSPGVEMQITDNQGIIASSQPDSSVIQHELTTREEDNGREFICTTVLRIDGIQVMKNTSLKLTVFYGARINDASCPSVFTWKEGSMETFTCSASGNPPADVECRKDNVSYSIGVQQEVNRKHKGVYRCIASNDYGSDAKDVTIDVEFFQLNVLVLALSVLSALACISMAAVGYYMYYRSQKMRMYRLKQQAAGTSMEQKCLNGNATA